MSKSSLDGVVLVLNRNYQPVHVVSVRDAMRLVVSEKALVIDEEYLTYDIVDWGIYSEDKDENIIRTTSKKFLAPDVIKLLEFDRKARYVINYTRENVYIRDNHQCQYCNKQLQKKDMTIDHIIPQSRQTDFGMTREQIQAWDNVVIACINCNSKKGNKTPSEANMSLQSTPGVPNWLGHIQGLTSRNLKPSWQTYLESFVKGKGEKV